MEAGYGAAGEPAGFSASKNPFVKRRAVNLIGLVGCLFVPWIIFTLVLFFTSLGSSPWLCWLLLAVVLFFGYVALRAWWGGKESGTPASTWFWFLFVTSLLAWIVGFSTGQDNYHTNMGVFLGLQGMSVYQNINADTDTGVRMMDAGQVNFVPGTALDLNHSMGFKDYDTFCVAPIISSANQGRVAEFWAVGMNCCSGKGPDFACGAYNNLTVTSGVRVIQDEHLTFYRLATKQAEAAYGLLSVQPVFLYWVADPQAEIQSYQSNAYTKIITGTIVAFFVQLLLVAIGAGIVTKLGH